MYMNMRGPGGPGMGRGMGGFGMGRGMRGFGAPPPPPRMFRPYRRGCLGGCLTPFLLIAGILTLFRIL